MNIRPFQALYPKTDLLTSPENYFAVVKEEFHDFLAGGFFRRTAQDGFFIYRIVAPHRSFLGLIGCADIEEYLKGNIKRHENTLPDKEQEQIRLLLRRRAQVKPIMLAYRNVAGIDAVLKQGTQESEPFLEVEEKQSGILHQLWQVTDGERIGRLQELFAQQVPCSYIADGHHRTSIMALLYERNRRKRNGQDFQNLLCAFFPTSELEILEFNRVVDGLIDISPTRFMARLSHVFHIEPLEGPAPPSRKHQLTLLLENEWYRLSWNEEVLEAHRSEGVLLDASLLNELVLRKILGIEDVRTDLRVKYVEGALGLEGLRAKTLKNERRLAFWLHPVSMEDFLSIADAGEVLPPKSTWFEPRLRNGLLMKEI